MTVPTSYPCVGNPMLLWAVLNVMSYEAFSSGRFYD